MSTTHRDEHREYIDVPDTPVEAPNAHGKFSLNEDWAAAGFGLLLLAGCLAGVIPNIKGWF